MGSPARSGAIAEFHVQSTRSDNQQDATGTRQRLHIAVVSCIELSLYCHVGKYTRMGTLGVLKVAMANPQGRINANKGTFSLGIRLSGYIYSDGGVFLHPRSQPGTGRPVLRPAIHTTPLAIGVLVACIHFPQPGQFMTQTAKTFQCDR